MQINEKKGVSYIHNIAMNIIITGASRGIGRETALALSEDRNHIILITGRNKTELQKTASRAQHGNISIIVHDLYEKGFLDKSLLDKIKLILPGVDILVNNAGSIISKPFTELSDEEMRVMMEVNYFAPANLIRTLVPAMNQNAHIINISSMGGFQGSAKFPGLSCYSASKAALATLTECLAVEFKDFGIFVNCLAPGSVQTEMLNEAFPGYKAPVSAKEMGNFVAYFALNGHKYFNGKILPVAMTSP